MLQKNTITSKYSILSEQNMLYKFIEGKQKLITDFQYKIINIYYFYSEITFFFIEKNTLAEIISLYTTLQKHRIIEKGVALLFL